MSAGPLPAEELLFSTEDLNAYKGLWIVKAEACLPISTNCKVPWYESVTSQQESWT